MDVPLVVICCASCLLLGYLAGLSNGHDKGWEGAVESRKAATERLEEQVRSLTGERNDTLDSKFQIEQSARVTLAKVDRACKKLRKALR